MAFRQRLLRAESQVRETLRQKLAQLNDVRDRVHFRKLRSTATATPFTRKSSFGIKSLYLGFSAFR